MAPLVNLAVLRELLAELDQLTGDEPCVSSRIDDLVYSISGYLGEPDPARALTRARELVTDGAPSPSPSQGQGQGQGQDRGPAQPRLPAPAELDSLLADLADLVRQPRIPYRTLDDVVSTTVALIPACVAAGVTRWTEGGPARTLAQTSPALAVLDRTQLELGQGPLLAARVREDGVAGGSFGEVGNSSALGAAGLRHGARSGLAVMLHSTAANHTAFSLYLETARAPDATVRRLATLQALHARISLDSGELAKAVAQLLDRRRDAGRAVAILMERHSITMQGAFDILTRAAHRLGTDLTTLTAHLLTSVDRLPRPLAADTVALGRTTLG